MEMISELNLHWRYTWLVLASFLAGVMNAMAGGGSFLSFPAMLGMGVPPVQANATNTVALWPGQLTSLAALRGDVRPDLFWAVAATSVVGGTAGALVLLHTQQTTFLRLIPWLLLTGTAIFGVSGPVSQWLRSRSRQAVAEHQPWRAPGFLPLFCSLFPVCFYIGYFGAGGGFLIMTILALFGLEHMHALNAMKVVAACLSNLCAILTFVLRGAVEWHFCVVSMVFAAAGGYLGARFARKIDAAALRMVVVVTGCVIAGYFFWTQPSRRTRGVGPRRRGLCFRLRTDARVAICGAASIHAWRGKLASTLFLLSVGPLLWLRYGFKMGWRSDLASNAMTLVLSLSVLVLRLFWIVQSRRTCNNEPRNPHRTRRPAATGREAPPARSSHARKGARPQDRRHRRRDPLGRWGQQLAHLSLPAQCMSMRDLPAGARAGRPRRR